MNEIGAAWHAHPLPVDWIILIRHGESEQNALTAHAGRDIGGGDHDARAVLGRPESWRLTERGIEQSRAAGRWLRAVLFGSVRPAVYTSPFERARRTAELLDLGSPSIVAELADRDWGSFFDGAPVDQRQARHAQARRLAAADPWGWRPPGGESSCDVYRRVARFLGTITAKADDRAEDSLDGPATSVIVSHGEVIRAARMLLEGTALRVPLAAGPDSRRTQHVPNAGLVLYATSSDGPSPATRHRWRSFVSDPADVPARWGALRWVELDEPSANSRSPRQSGVDDRGAAGDGQRIAEGL